MTASARSSDNGWLAAGSPVMSVCPSMVSLVMAVVLLMIFATASSRSMERGSISALPCGKPMVSRTTIESPSSTTRSETSRGGSEADEVVTQPDQSRATITSRVIDMVAQYHCASSARMTALLHAHSGLRFLILLLGAVNIVVLLVGLATKKPFGKLHRILGASFAGSLHLQLLIGLTLVAMGRWFPALIGHLTMMLLAATSPRRWR